jgi:anti-sigma regulatory factor (Ser/Thr protein kinase)
MPERDAGRVATLLAAPTQQLERPAPDRARLRPAPAHSEDLRKPNTVDGWPHRSYLQLGALPGAVPCARLHTKLVLWEWGLDRLVETAELLVSEIITNAVQASGSLPGAGGDQQASGLPSVWFWLATDQRDVLIQVWDGGHDTPTWQDVGQGAESGRGLLLVERLSARWGAYTPDGWTGKVVWAIVSGERAQAS